MKFHSLGNSIKETMALSQEYQSAHEIGVIKLGNSCLFFKKSLKVYYIPYTELARAYRRVMLIAAKMCCASGNIPVENLVLNNLKDEEIAVIRMPGEKAGIACLEEIKQKNPEIITVCPEKPKMPGKSEKSQQAYKAKNEAAK